VARQDPDELPLLDDGDPMDPVLDDEVDGPLLLVLRGDRVDLVDHHVGHGAVSARG
jgi:hypothetical protein